MDDLKEDNHKDMSIDDSAEDTKLLKDVEKSTAQIMEDEAKSIKQRGKKETKGDKGSVINGIGKDKNKLKVVLCVLCGLLFVITSVKLAIDGAVEKSTPIESSMSYKDFISKLDKGDIKCVTIKAKSFLCDVELKDGKNETIINPNTDTFIEELGEKGVEVKIQMAEFDSELAGTLTAMLSVGFSFLLTCLMVFYFVKMISMLKGKVNDGGKSKKIVVTDENRVTFADVAGLSEEKEELQYAILSLKDSDKLKARGSKPIRGVLLEGGPGVGKTLIAKAVAGEAEVPFYSYSGSDFTEMFVGMGAMRVRKMFDEAIENAPCVIFIDEIDAVGGKRSSGSYGGNSERDNTLIALLEKMDGMSGLNNVLIIGATNRVDALDEALIRPGRFDKVIHISRPRSKEDREAIVNVHLKNKTLAEGVTLEQVAKECYGFSGAEIESALNDAILESFKDNKDGIINLDYVNKAVMKLLVKGVAKGKHSETDKERVAIHEAGHALMTKHLGKKLIKVSIQSYSGGVGGFTREDNEANEINFMTEQDFTDRVKILYGGMVAEEVLLGNASTGASNDLERATQLLDQMLSSYGLVEGSLIVKKVLNNSVVGNTVSDDYIRELENIANNIKSEVTTLFSTSELKSELRLLADELIDKEVIYYS